MKLVQVRPCDGKCCEESPRFPDRRYKIPRCRYFKDGLCQVKTGERAMPKGDAPKWPGHSAAEDFQKSCVEWPQKHCDPKLGETAGCCWQWVDGN